MKLSEDMESFCRSIGPQSWTRILVFCSSRGIQTPEQFGQLTEGDVRGYRQIGALTVKRLKSSLKKRGVKLMKIERQENYGSVYTL
jgi:hypothetical protein